MGRPLPRFLAGCPNSWAACRHPIKVPIVLLFTVIALIILVGFLISIPPKLRLANNVLLSLYTGYIAISVVLSVPLLRRNAQL